MERVVVLNVPEAQTRRELIERGEVDIADNLSPEVLNALATNPDLLIDLRYNLTVVYFILNAVGPLQTPSARQALCHAFPYEEVITGVYEGYAKRPIGPLAELCRGFDPTTYAYEPDLERARVLLDQAGVPAGTTLTMIDPISTPWVASIAELLRANLDRLGLKLETQQVDYATLISLYYGDMPAEERPHLMPALWSPDYNDGWNHLWPQPSSAAWNAGNAGHYANPEVDALLDQTRDAADEGTYQAALSRVQKIVTHDEPQPDPRPDPQPEGAPNPVRARRAEFTRSTRAALPGYRRARATHRAPAGPVYFASCDPDATRSFTDGWEERTWSRTSRVTDERARDRPHALR